MSLLLALLSDAPSVHRVPLQTRVAGAIFSAAALAPAAYGNLLTSTLSPAAGAPIGQQLWDNPVQKPRSAMQPVSFRAPPVEVFFSAKPFNEYRWPNPSVAARAGQDYAQGVSLLVLAPPSQTTPPLNQYFWPNPAVRVASTNVATMFRPAPDPVPGAEYSDYHRRYRRISYR